MELGPQNQNRDGVFWGLIPGYMDPLGYGEGISPNPVARGPAPWLNHGTLRGVGRRGVGDYTSLNRPY